MAPIQPETIDIQRIEDTTGHRFSRPQLLAQALTHASTTDSRLDSNERLEFLGDAILGSVVCELIFDRFPDLLEGEMTKIKSAVVSRRACAIVAQNLGLDQALVLGKGMHTANGLPSSLAACALEAFIAALHIDAGPEAAKRFIIEHMGPMVDELAESEHHDNYKSLLQQHAQQLCGDTPTYRVLDEKGPDHAKCFKVAVEINGHWHESAWAASKKQAEQLAAENALVALGVIERGPQQDDPICDNFAADEEDQDELS